MPSSKTDVSVSMSACDSRTCPQCGVVLKTPVACAGMAVQCPRCQTTVPALSGQDTLLPDGRSRPVKTDTALGWTLSFLIHSVLLACFSGMALLPGPGSSDDDGQKAVSIVAEERARDIGTAQAQPLEIQSTDSLQISTVRDSIAVKPIETIGASAGSTQVGVAMTLEVGGGSSAGAMKGDWSSFGASGGGGSQGGVSFLGLMARGGKFVYVVDRSGSMSGERLEVAKAELARSVSQLKRGMEFYIIFFDSNNRHEPMPAPALVKASEQNRRKYMAWMHAIKARGGTDPTSAMLLALSLKPDAVWLLSDGGFHEKAADAIRAANPGRKVQIHTIAFYDNSGERVLQRIAEENRGTYRFVQRISRGPMDTLRRP